MEKRKSYQELLNEYTMSQTRNETQSKEWYIDFLLNGLLQQQREKQLRIEIDYALDKKDEEAFVKLAKELSSLIGN